MDVRDSLSTGELTAALGELTMSDNGWHKREGSFLQLLEQSPPRRISEGSKLIETDFDEPLLIRRTSGGLSKVAAKHLTAAKMLHQDPVVRPSRCVSLAINFGATPMVNGDWNLELIPSNPCQNCSFQFKTFTRVAMSPENPMEVTTAASNDKNIMLQTHGAST